MMATNSHQKMIPFEIATGKIVSGTSWVRDSLLTSYYRQATCPDPADTTYHRR